MQAYHLPTKASYLACAAAFSLLLSTGFAQVANSNTAPETTNGTTPAAVTTTTTTATTTTAAASDQTPTVMSPFEVDSTEDAQVRARRNTLAGSRINTDLNDIASPITVVTKDFMNDIGAANVNDILTYEVGTEGTKDFSSNTSQLGRTSDNATQDPNGATRSRGLAPLDFTRDYFYSLQDVTTGYNSGSVGFDSYNLDSVTIIRGADSILAGLGSPGGLLNISPQVAGLERNAYDFSYRFGSFGDKRAVINSNNVLIPGVLALRFDYLYADVGFKQQPAYDIDKRYYLTATWKPFKKTTIHASYEDADIHEHLPNTFTPEDDITQWIQLGKPAAPPPAPAPSTSQLPIQAPFSIRV